MTQPALAEKLDELLGRFDYFALGTIYAFALGLLFSYDPSTDDKSNERFLGIDIDDLLLTPLFAGMLVDGGLLGRELKHIATTPPLTVRSCLEAVRRNFLKPPTESLKDE